ncbi:hypothetical protein PLICRDRAFT_171132 [Plicaturopsis crispa FD-325 SS-3]|nr:hypothetical protein PLICRDRAFT_171132 [Plicaturopsis crispa FD-325 SS-3]
MDANDLHPADDYSTRFFIWHEWIQANGPLTTANVFDYFATSMFYDKQSNNQVLRMQTMHTGMPIENEAEELKRFTGIEFALVQAQPPSLFIIHKRERLSPDEVRPLAAYFIISNRIYQSPDLYTVISNRLLTTLYSLQSSLDILRSHRPDYTPRTGFVWPIVDPSVADKSTKKGGASEELPPAAEAEQDPAAADAAKRKPVINTNSKADTSSTPKKQQNNLLLLNAMRTTAAHSNMSFSSRALTAEPESATAETPGPTSGGRSSATPVSAVPTSATSRLSAAQDVPPAKGPAGAGKKKRKRTLATS